MEAMEAVRAAVRAEADAAAAAPVPGTTDLSALAWVQGELRRALESAHKALRRALKDAQALAESDVDAVDPAVLRGARQQLHQGAGALELIGLPAAATVLRASEALVQRHVARPAGLDQAAVEAIEHASFALLDYIGRLLAGHEVSPLALFPQYRAVQEAAGAERVHPADLWIVDWRWLELPDDAAAAALPPDGAAQRRLEEQLLTLMKSPPGSAAFDQAGERMSLLCARLGAGAQGAGDRPRSATLWKLASAVFEAQARGLLEPDVHGKRVASRLLQQFRQLGRGDEAVSERLAQDLLFFCAQSAPPPDAATAPRLAAVRHTYGLADATPVGYATSALGRFDPALVAQARKRVVAAKESWGAVAAGEAHRADALVEQFSLVGDSLQRLYPGGETLAAALQSAADRARHDGAPPPVELAMEVATSLLYLDASLDDAEFDPAAQGERVLRLAERIVGAQAGGAPQPLEAWMEALYRRVSDRQTLGSVVQEVRAALAESEKLIDQFFRNPSDPAVLVPVQPQLQAMRGVLSVLGLDEASHAVLRMRDDIDRIVGSAPGAAQADTFDRLADNLGALGFLVDMFSVQPQLAKSLFAFDPVRGVLEPLMGRPAAAQRGARAAPAPVEAPRPAAETPLPELAPVAAPALPAELAGDDEMLGIFLEEAAEVIADARAAAAALAEAPGDVMQLTALRRAFHTLKGSSRMVGLAEFGETAWAGEQVYNRQLADQQPVDAPLLRFSGRALDALERWVGGIGAGQPSHPEAAAEVAAAREALDAERGAPAVPAAAPAPMVPDAATPDFDHTGGFDLAPEEFDWLPLPGATAAPLVVPSFPPDMPSAAALDLSPPAPVEPAPAEELTFARFELPQAPAAAPASEAPAAPAEIDLSFDLELPPLAEPAAGFDAQVPEPSFELAFEPLEAGAAPAVEADAVAEAAPAAGFGFDLDLDLNLDLPFEPTEVAPAEPAPAPTAAEEVAVEMKQVGPLRIGAPLFNIYLNEADDLSKRLDAELSAWSRDLGRPVGEDAIALAHSLAGSSATVGFNDLSQLARALEHTLAESHALGHGTLEDAQLFTRVAERIRQLLHQFAGGFLKSPPPEMTAELAEREAALARERQARRDAAEAVVASPPEAPAVAEAPAAPAPVVQAAPLPVEAPPSLGVPEFKPLAGPPAQPRAAAARPEAPDTDDDIDAVDAVDAELFPIFEEEGRDLLPQLAADLREWARHPTDTGLPAAAMRTLHTLKGGARLAGAMRLGEMCHRLETRIERLVAKEPVEASDVEALQARSDALAAVFEALRAPAAAVAPAQEAPLAAPAAPVAAAPAAVDQPQPDADGFDWSRFATSTAAVAQPAGPAIPPAAQSTVRVRTPLLDRLVNQAGEVSIARTRIEADVQQIKGSLADLTDNLERLRLQLRDLELQAETQVSSRMEAAKAAQQAFDPLEFDRYTRFQELTRMMAESVNDVATVHRTLMRAVEGAEDGLVAQGRLTRDIQDDLLRTRMVEFEGQSERLYRVVRQAAKETGKQVRLDIVGGAVEIDRGVLDRMTPAFEHLLRNCVAHGIERPEARAAAGKEPIGTITVALEHVGNEVAVEFRDDGAGLDLEAIRAQGVASGLIDANARPSDAELAALIWQPGFSTAREVTKLVGRGVGMDVVRSEVAAIGGRIETASTAGKGTVFRLLVPLTTAVTQVVMLRAGAATVAVPSTLVETVHRATPEELDHAYAGAGFMHGDEPIPFFWLGALLQSGARSEHEHAQSRSVVVVRSAQQRVALHVDEVLGNQEAVVKHLGPQLARVPGLVGMTLLPSGEVALIYNPVALAAVYGDAARAMTRAALQPGGAAPCLGGVAAAPETPLVLVVDDSLTVRRVTQRLLAREGYRVALAKDGLEALERLAEERPQVVLSDIEMPRMDGFDLVRNMRSDSRWNGLPVIMITSRIAQKHRDVAAELGVDHYLGKPYSEDDLLGLIARFAARPSPQPAAA